MRDKLSAFLLLGLLVSPVAMAGQGLYLKMSGYVPNAAVQVTDSNCVDGVGNITMNTTTYLDANISGTCLFEKSYVKLSVQQNGQELANYTLTISADGSALTPQGYNAIGNNILMASLYPHPGLTGTQDWVTISLAGHEDNWMQQSSNAIANKAISAVILPGSHDTGTYGINSQSEVSSDISDTLKFWLQFDPLKIQHLRNWATSQNLDTTTQLNVGIRYLDLRLCKSSSGVLETCHSISGDTIANILNQASDFLNNPLHQQEIIILDINHLYSITNNDIDQLVLLLQNAFANKIASPYGFTPGSLVSNFWNQKKQVIVIIDNDYATSTYPSIFWSENSIISPYPDQQSSSGLQQEMQSVLMERDASSLFVLQSQETPTDATIINGFNPFASNPDSLLKMTTTYKRDISDWYAQPANQAALKQNGNIIIEDFTNGVDLTELAKQLN